MLSQDFDPGERSLETGETCKDLTALANATPVDSKLHCNGEEVVEEERCTHEEEKGEVSKDTSSTAWLVWCILGTAHCRR